MNSAMRFNRSSGVTDQMMAHVKASPHLRLVETATNYTTTGDGDNPHHHSYAYLALLKHDSVATLLEGTSIREKVDGSGHNIFVPRGKTETHSHWRTRTASIAQALVANLDMHPDCPHVTFNNGRIILQRTPEDVFYIKTTNNPGWNPFGEAWADAVDPIKDRRVYAPRRVVSDYTPAGQS